MKCIFESILALFKTLFIGEVITFGSAPTDRIPIRNIYGVSRSDLNPQPFMLLSDNRKTDTGGSHQNAQLLSMRRSRPG